MSLRWKILIFSAGGILIIMALLGYFGIAAARESTKQTLDERLLLAEQVAQSIDFNIQQVFQEIQVISQSILVKVNQGDPELNSFLKDMKLLLPLNTKYICLIDSQKNIIITEPPIPGSENLSIDRNWKIDTVLETNKPVVSNIEFDDSVNDYVAYIVAPLQDSNAGSPLLIAVAVDISSTSLNHLINFETAGKIGYVEIVDGRGVVLATSKPENFLKPSDHDGVFANLIQNHKTAVSTCHSCHDATEEQNKAKDIITFAPLSTAPWGVVIRQPEGEALANTSLLKQRLLIFGLISGLVVLPAIWFSTKRITDPINKITVASKKIAQGSLDEPVTMPGRDEICVLSQSFDTMRTKLKDSIEKINERTKDLEALNIEKAKLYEDLLEKEQVLAGLLKRSISAQEEERKRIARELHDETSQALTTLAIGLETIATSAPKDPERLKAALKKNQELIVRILDDIHRLILDLRPSILDDMGLIPALEWYAHNRLETEGIKVHLETSGFEKRLPAHIELALFRIIQETLSNIAQHAKAERANVSLDFQDGCVKAIVEDDGVGFDTNEVLSNTSDKRGWGLLGITERVEALNGKIVVESKPKSGTRLDIEIPVKHKDG